MQLKVICDNASVVDGLATEWGFACLVGEELLFDTSASVEVLLGNMERLGVRPEALKTVAVSHGDEDHTGGLMGLLERNPNLEVYIHPGFPPEILWRRVREQETFERTSMDALRESCAKLVLVDELTELSPDVYLTGPYPTREQALVLRRAGVLVVLTGCAHPNPVDILEGVRKHMDEPIDLVLGGFHLDRPAEEIAAVIGGFRRLGVRRAGPCHCTGEEAMRMFREEYGDDFVEVGAGLTLQV